MLTYLSRNPQRVLRVSDCPMQVNNRAFPTKTSFGAHRYGNSMSEADWRITQHTTAAHRRIAFTP